MSVVPITVDRVDTFANVCQGRFLKFFSRNVTLFYRQTRACLSTAIGRIRIACCTCVECAVGVIRLGRFLTVPPHHYRTRLFTLYRSTGCGSRFIVKPCRLAGERIQMYRALALDRVFKS